jgi:hypothetical protein
MRRLLLVAAGVVLLTGCVPPNQAHPIGSDNAGTPLTDALWKKIRGQPLTAGEAALIAADEARQKGAVKTTATPVSATPRRDAGKKPAPSESALIAPKETAVLPPTEPTVVSPERPTLPAAPVGECSISSAGAATMQYQTAKVDMHTQDIYASLGRQQPVSQEQVASAYKALVDGIDKAYSGCHKGDMIRLPIILAQTIADRCDMTKAVTPDGSDYICVQK